MMSGGGKIGGVFEGFVFEPEDVEVDLVAFDEVVVGEALEAFAFGALVAVLGVVAGDEVVEIGALQLVFFQREVLVGSEIVDPELFGPRLFLRRLAVEEKHVRLYALRVEDARRQAQERVHVRLLEQLAANRLTCPAFEEHVVRHDDSGPAMLLEDREDVLEKVELLVAGRRPEVVAVDRQAFLLRLAFFIHNRHAALLAERRIGHHHFVIFAALAAERVTNLDRHLIRSVRADPVQEHIHATQPRHAVHQFDAVERSARQLHFLLTVELIVRLDRTNSCTPPAKTRPCRRPDRRSSSSVRAASRRRSPRSAAAA